jgi:hypothetical protein
MEVFFENNKLCHILQYDISSLVNDLSERENILWAWTQKYRVAIITLLRYFQN